MKIFYETEIEYEWIRLKSISSFIENEKYIWLDKLHIKQNIEYSLSEIEFLDLYKIVFK